MAKTRTSRQPLVKIENEVDISWLAAVIDGEGHIRLDRPLKAYPDYIYPRITVVNTNLEFLEKCLEITQAGKIYERTKTGNPKHKDSWAWIVCGQPAIDIINQVLLYLIIKKEKAIQVISANIDLNKLTTNNEDNYEHKRKD